MAKALAGKLPTPLTFTGAAKLKTFRWQRPHHEPLPSSFTISVLRPGMQVRWVTRPGYIPCQEVKRRQRQPRKPAAGSRPKGRPAGFGAAAEGGRGQAEEKNIVCIRGWNFT
jgi:hypothetical protein